MQKLRFRHGALVSACCMALCYLLAGAAPSVAQIVLPDGCLAEAGQTSPPPNCHVVRVGPPSFQNPFGDTFFFDLDSGFRSDDPALGGQNPVITVIPVGHTVQWQFFYSHSSTAGHCVSFQQPLNCTPNGQWDSLIKSGNAPTPTTDNLHTVQFNQPGVFTYFCGVHFSLMRGIVVVLGNSQDYDVFANPDPTIGPPLPTPTLTIFAGDPGNFSGTLNFYNRFGSIPGTTLTLACSPGGTPRNPTSCLSTAIPVVLIVPPLPKVFATTTINFPVSESTGGDYTFEIAATASPPVPPNVPFSHKKTVLLHVNDLTLSAPSPGSATIRQGAPAPQVNLTAQALSQFSGNVTISCNSVPAGIGCTSTPGSFLISPGFPQAITATLTNTTGVPPGNYTVSIVAASTKTPNGAPFTRTQTFSLRIFQLHAEITAPATATPGNPISVTVAIKDQDGALFTNYAGTVSFSASGVSASVPGEYTFSPIADGGDQTFTVTPSLTAVGPLVVTARDINDGSLFASTGIIRVGPSNPGNTVQVTSSRTTIDAFFQNDSITFTAQVTSPSGTPTGSVRFYDGTTDIGLSPLNLVAGKPTAILDLEHFTPGGHVITAVYEPDTPSFNANLSPPFSQPRSPAPRCVNSVCPGSR